MYYGNMEKRDVVNGPGVRTLLFVSGCTHQCRGCHNQDSWDFSYGDLFTEEVEDEIIEALSSPVVQGFSLLGGEPFDNVDDCIKLLKRIKRECPNKDIWVWTGYTFEYLSKHPSRRYLLELCDVLVDGRYNESLRDLSLYYRGSSNQRIINVQESLDSNNIIFNKFYYK